MMLCRDISSTKVDLPVLHFEGSIKQNETRRRRTVRLRSLPQLPTSLQRLADGSSNSPNSPEPSAVVGNRIKALSKGRLTLTQSPDNSFSFS